VVHVRIASLSVDSVSNQPVIILRPVDESHAEGRLVPIWIGQAEATAILLALQGITPPRPMTHDLLASVIGQMGATLSRVEITRIEGGTFYANLIVADENGAEREIDARPSDSIALAVRTGSPIYLSERVLEEAAVIEVAEEDEEDEVERFRAFLDHVDPSDFQS